MSLPTYTGETNIISQLHDRPITDDGLTTAQFKAKFDYAMTSFKLWFNTTFISALNNTFQEKLSVSGIVKADGAGNTSAAEAGTDYQAPLTFDSSPTDGSNNPVTSDGIYEALSGKAAKSTMTSATLDADEWEDGEYTVSVTGVTATSVVELLPGAEITASELAALQAANLQDGGQTSGAVTLKAFGAVPTVDIPVRFIVRGDM